MRYPVVIHKDPESDYGVTVPDLPGCFSAGETLDEALESKWPKRSNVIWKAYCSMANLFPCRKPSNITKATPTMKMASGLS